MIPVLAVPVINRPDLLRTMVESIDHPVDRLLVIDNSPDSSMWPVAQDAAPPCVGDIVVVEAPWNMGLAAAWNLAVQSAPRASFWMLVNNDIRFGAGDLDRLASEMADPAPKVAMLFEYAAFALNPAVVEQAGWFDENCYPIYCEDSDYRWRTRLLDIPEVSIVGTTTHVGSASYQHTRELYLANQRTYARNVAYYTDKWGGPPRREVFRTPFDRGGSVADWTLRLSHLAALRWDDPDGETTWRGRDGHGQV